MWLRDPLLWFLLIGAGIYLFTLSTDDDGISYHIEVGDNDVARLAQQWQAQMRRPPTATELDGLLNQYVREEIYYREARRLGLEADDTIVRRRLVQKLTFLTEDVATAVPPDEAELAAYFAEHQETYRIPERFSFSHRYFSSDRHDNAEDLAAAAVTDSAVKGDPFMLQKSYTLRSEREIGDLFGRPFASALLKLTPDDTWQGPLQSAYGWHPVRLSSVSPSRIPALAEVADRVAADARQAQREIANQRYFADLRERYDVSLPPALADAAERALATNVE